MKKTVYVGTTLEFVHHGHINIIEQASSHGELIIGLLTDKAIASHKNAALTFEQRKAIAMNVKGVNKVVEQDQWDYSHNIKNTSLILWCTAMTGRGPLASVRAIH